jgi:hypothetical protein
VALAMALAGCATAGAGRVRPADEPLGPDTALSSGAAAQAAYARGVEGTERGDAARDAGNLEQARAEWIGAADAFLEAEKAGAADWRLALDYRAADLLLRGDAFDRAAAAALRVARDPRAAERSRAQGWHLAAQALMNAATADARAGKLPPAKVLFADQRGTEPLVPRPPPGTWSSFVEAVDEYLAVSAADPELSRPADQRTLFSPGRLEVGAARVTFSFDDVADARRRLETVLARWLDDTTAVVEAIPLLLQTYLVTHDTAGHQAAAERIRLLLEERAGKTGVNGKEGIARAQDELRRALSGANFSSAQALLDGGKPAEAARSFEVVAADGISADAANALHNAAVAWDRAGEPEKAAADRQRILAERPESRVAPADALLLAAYQSRKGDHAVAAGIYADFLTRWPDQANRCIAMQNVASELDAVRRAADAAERYLAFGKDPGCARDPALATIALRRARALFDLAGKPARARDAAAAADAVARKPAKEK